MQIRTRMCMSADGYVTTADGWPAQLADPTFVPGKSHGFPEFQKACEAVLMGRTTFEPALTAPHWPWHDRPVYVLGSQRPAGTPDHVVVDDWDVFAAGSATAQRAASWLTALRGPSTPVAPGTSRFGPARPMRAAARTADPAHLSRVPTDTGPVGRTHPSLPLTGAFPATSLSRASGT